MLILALLEAEQPRPPPHQQPKLVLHTQALSAELKMPSGHLAVLLRQVGCKVKSDKGMHVAELIAPLLLARRPAEEAAVAATLTKRE